MISAPNLVKFSKFIIKINSIINDYHFFPFNLKNIRSKLASINSPFLSDYGGINHFLYLESLSF